MFAWHETTLRNLCRLAFGLVVALPTCAVVASVVWCRTPLSLEYHCRTLSEQLVLDVRIEQVSFPRPGVTLYERVSFDDPRTSRPLARFGALEWQVDGQNSTILCSHAELLDTSRLDLVAELINRALRRFAGSQAVVEIDAPQLTLHLAEGRAQQTLTDVHGQLQASANQPEAVVEFHLAGNDEAAPARLSWQRGSTESATEGTITLDTGPTPLPARLVALCCPGWEVWGLASNFRGRLSWRQPGDGWTSEVKGQITGVDLQDLLSQRLGHRLSGEAEVQLDQVHVERGRLVDAAGTIKAGPGLIARSLLAAVVSQQKATDNNPSVHRDLAAYKLMAFHFTIDETGLTLAGVCPDAAGALLVEEAGDSLLNEPPGSQSLLGLVRLLANSGEVVPADPSAQLLLRVLPVRIAAPTDAATVPQAHVPKNPVRRQ